MMFHVKPYQRAKTQRTILIMLKTCLFIVLIFFSVLFCSCKNKTSINKSDKQNDITIDYDLGSVEESGIKTIHVFVALCDNKYQGITRVSAALGNGQNLNTNLYWGALYGIRTYFKKSNECRCKSNALDN